VVSYSPHYELVRWTIQELRTDAEIDSLMFKLSPAVDGTDRRIYHSKSALTEVQRKTLPRIVVAAFSDPDEQVQQYDEADSASVTMWIHVITPRGQATLGEAILARVRKLLQSTTVVSDRIVASPIVAVGPTMDTIEEEFEQANRISQRFAAEKVGVHAYA